MSEEDEQIGYKPKNVREALREMKDISELMVDLAYAAIIFDSKEIAMEVRKLEERMDRLKYEIRIICMLAARSAEEAEQLTGVLQVAAAAEQIANASADIVDLLSTSIEARSFIPFILQKADEKIRLIFVPSGSVVVGKPIGDTGFEARGAKIIAIRRGRRWIYDPGDDVRIRGEDILIVRGVEAGYEWAKQYIEEGIA